MSYLPINLRQKLALVTEHWSPRIVAQMNNYHFKLVKLQGEFIWHKHDDTDETFLVVDGDLRIEFRDREVVLGAGEMLVVPRGTEHRPVAQSECHVLLIEPAGTVNTGDSGGPMTAPGDLWT